MMFFSKALLPRPSDVGYWIFTFFGFYLLHAEAGENSAFEKICCCQCIGQFMTFSFRKDAYYTKIRECFHPRHFPTECGIGPILSGRIVGGNETEPNKWPWQASLQLTHPQYGKVGHWCGAVIIHKQWVMTAAHCILNPLFSLPQPVFWKVRIGDHNLKLTEGHEKTIQVSEVHFHPWYHAYDKDIALLKLEKEMEFNDYVRAICLPDEEDGYLGMRCVATGWGKVDFDKRGSNVLREVEIQVLDNHVCHGAYYPTYKIPIKGWHLCAGELEGGKGTCQGDSGGPLQCLMNGQYYVAGITSFGSGCAKEGFPDIYTRVSYFADWIEEIMSRPPAGK